MGKMQTKSKRIEARLTPEDYELIAYAAKVTGRSISEFLVASAGQAAREEISERQILRFSLEAQQRFADALADPPEPNAALQRAKQSHDRLIDE